MFKTLKMTKRTLTLTAEFSALFDSEAAYRPGGKRYARDVNADLLLHQLADAARPLGLTSGDVLVIATTLVRAVDQLQSFADGWDHVLMSIATDDLTAMSGHPMRRFVKAASVVDLMKLVGAIARPEAYDEFMEQETTPDETRALQEEYAHITATPAPLLAEFQRMQEIKTRLAELGADVDEELNRAIKRQVGVQENPFNL